MTYFLKNNPNRIINRLILIIGIVLFCPIYYFNYHLISRLLTPNQVTKLYTSFETDTFREIVTSIIERGLLNDLLNVYLLNILSAFGFMFMFFSITLIIARSINSESKFYKVAFLFPILSILIAVFDISTSLLFLYLIRNPSTISDLTTFFINGNYMLRIFLLCIEVFWTILLGAILLIRYIKNRTSDWM